jgi:hypothetical protein
VISPPIICARVRLIVRPSPVPHARVCRCRLERTGKDAFAIPGDTGAVSTVMYAHSADPSPLNFGTLGRDLKAAPDENAPAGGI